MEKIYRVWIDEYFGVEEQEMTFSEVVDFIETYGNMKNIVLTEVDSKECGVDFHFILNYISPTSEIKIRKNFLQRFFQRIF